ncbi:MAG: hypothetical protein J1F18_09930 [Lachnospiraceae bacterium]|nr:hypothetical protein [Lachnospiraceae bacterium]
MSQSDRFDEFNNENEGQSNTSDTYTTESSADIYNTPDISNGMSGDAPGEDAPVADVVVESVSVDEGAVTDVVIESAPEEEIVEADAVVPYSNPYNNPNNPYESNPYNNPNNPYGNGPYNNNQYGYNPYGGQMPPNGNQDNNPYNNNPYNNNPYNNNQYNNNPYNNNQYNNNQYNNNQYNNNQYNNPYGSVPSGNPPYNNNQYSPYAVPPKKKSTGLIIGIVVGVAVLFLIAFCTLIYRAVTLYNQDHDRPRNNSRDDYRFDDDDDDWGVDRNQRNRDRDRDEDDYDPDDDYDDYDDDYDYDDWYDDWYNDYYDDDYYDDDSEYYDFHNDVKYNLSYSVDLDYYEYDTDNDSVYIYVDYPVIKGDNVPNLDKLNAAIWAEVEYFTDYYEDEYADYMTEDDDYFYAYAEGYVTYMDEEKLSVVFQEEIISSYYDYAYVYCINIDMEHGVILDNENMLSINDDFSADFRARSEVQNPTSKTYLSYMSDQEMTRYFNSSDIIVFYTPMGMEIGFNYDTDYSHGWVTVTYKEYEQYLKVF